MVALTEREIEEKLIDKGYKGLPINKNYYPSNVIEKSFTREYILGHNVRIKQCHNFFIYVVK